MWPLSRDLTHLAERDFRSRDLKMKLESSPQKWTREEENLFVWASETGHWIQLFRHFYCRKQVPTETSLISPVANQQVGPPSTRILHLDKNLSQEKTRRLLNSFDFTFCGFWFERPRMRERVGTSVLRWHLRGRAIGLEFGKFSQTSTSILPGGRHFSFVDSPLALSGRPVSFRRPCKNIAPSFLLSEMEISSGKEWRCFWEISFKSLSRDASRAQISGGLF